MAPALTLVLAVGDRVSRIVAPEDHEWYPVRPMSDDEQPDPAVTAPAGSHVTRTALRGTQARPVRSSRGDRLRPGVRRPARSGTRRSTPTPRTARTRTPRVLRYFDDHGSEYLGASILQAFGMLAAGASSRCISTARRRTRNPEPAVRGARHGRLRAGRVRRQHVAARRSPTRSSPTTSWEARCSPRRAADDLLDSPVIDVANVLGLTGVLALGFWLVKGSLDAMRIGLLDPLHGRAGDRARPGAGARLRPAGAAALAGRAGRAVPGPLAARHAAGVDDGAGGAVAERRGCAAAREPPPAELAVAATARWTRSAPACASPAPSPRASTARNVDRPRARRHPGPIVRPRNAGIDTRGNPRALLELPSGGSPLTHPPGAEADGRLRPPDGAWDGDLPSARNRPTKEGPSRPLFDLKSWSVSSGGNPLCPPCGRCLRPPDGGPRVFFPPDPKSGGYGDRACRPNSLQSRGGRRESSRCPRRALPWRARRPRWPSRRGRARGPRAGRTRWCRG